LVALWTCDRIPAMLKKARLALGGTEGGRVVAGVRCGWLWRCFQCIAWGFNPTQRGGLDGCTAGLKSRARGAKPAEAGCGRPCRKGWGVMARSKA
jgi:hypothetical protein